MIYGIGVFAGPRHALAKLSYNRVLSHVETRLQIMTHAKGRRCCHQKNADRRQKNGDGFERLSS